MNTDEQRYEELVRSHLGLIRRCCWLSSGTDEHLFNELFQSVLLDLWRAMPLLDPAFSREQQRQWVKSRCRGVCSHHRRRRRKPLLPLGAAMYMAPDEPDFGETIEELAEELDTKERRILDLHLQGYRRREIADALAVSPATITKAFRRIVDKMKKKYQKIIKS